MRALPVVGGLLLLGACARQAASTGPERDLSQFECNDRRVGYMLAGGFAAEEAGVTMACDGEDPRIIKWTADAGERSESKHALTAAQFNSVWEKVDATGWRFLEEDCNNPNAADSDPVYLIDVGDHSSSVTLNCQGKTLPFPYDRIVNELDLRAAGFGDQDAPAR